MSAPTTPPAAELLYVVMPVYNEEASIGAVVEEWSGALASAGATFRFLILNDGSKDGTADALTRLSAANPAVEVVHKPNSGHGQTCIQGYREAVARGARWVFQIDSDGQCDPRYFAAAWEKRGGHDAVFGKRVDRDDGVARKMISWLCRIATHVATGVDVRDPNVPYRLMRGDVLAVAVQGFPTSFNLANILVAVLLQKGLGERMGFVEIGFRDRTGGEPSVKWMKFATEGWRLYSALGMSRRFIRERAAAIAALVRSR